MGTLDFKQLQSKDPDVKYGFSKKIVELAKENPAMLYPYFNEVAELLDNENNIIKWSAIDIIGLLSSVDKKNKADKYLRKIISFVAGGKLITANHAVYALGLIAQAKPQYRPEIRAALLGVEKYTYETDECRNIVLGKAVLALGDLADEIKDDKQIRAFIERVAHNSRNATAKKALGFIAKDQEISGTPRQLNKKKER